MALSGFRGLPKNQKKRVDQFYETMARSSADATRANVRDALLRALVDTAKVPPGHRVKEIKRALNEVGITDDDGSVFETLKRTHAYIGRNAATWLRTYRDPAVWGYEYRTAEDDRVRPGHAALDGKRYKKEDPFWKKYAPPNGWNCRCVLIPIYRGSVQARARRFGGVPDVDSEFLWNPGLVLSKLMPKRMSHDEEKTGTELTGWLKPDGSWIHGQYNHAEALVWGGHVPDDIAKDAHNVDRARIWAYQHNWVSLHDRNDHLVVNAIGPISRRDYTKRFVTRHGKMLGEYKVWNGGTMHGVFY